MARSHPDFLTKSGPVSALTPALTEDIGVVLQPKITGTVTDAAAAPPAVVGATVVVCPPNPPMPPTPTTACTPVETDRTATWIAGGVYSLNSELPPGSYSIWATAGAKQRVNRPRDRRAGQGDADADERRDQPSLTPPRCAWHIVHAGYSEARMGMAIAVAIRAAAGHHHHGVAIGSGSGSGAGAGGGGGGATTTGGGAGFGSSSAVQRMQWVSPSGFSSPHSGHTLLPTRLRPPAPGSRRSVESLLTPLVVVGTFDDTQNSG